MMRKLPWLSLGLLWLVYSSTGHSLCRLAPFWLILLLMIGFVLAQLLRLTPGYVAAKANLYGWISADVLHLLISGIICFFLIGVLLWHRIFNHVVLTLAVEILTRLDLQGAELTWLQSFVILIFVWFSALTMSELTSYL